MSLYKKWFKDLNKFIIVHSLIKSNSTLLSWVSNLRKDFSRQLWCWLRSPEHETFSVDICFFVEEKQKISDFKYFINALELLEYKSICFMIIWADKRRTKHLLHPEMTSVLTSTRCNLCPTDLPVDLWLPIDQPYTASIFNMSLCFTLLSNCRLLFQWTSNCRRSVKNVFEYAT
jgi:hypothetical protein